MGTNEIFNVRNFINEGSSTPMTDMDVIWAGGVNDGAWMSGYITLEEHDQILEWINSQ